MQVVYVDQNGQFGVIDEQRLDATTERHLVALPPPPLTTGDPIAALHADPQLGLVVASSSGCPSRRHLNLLGHSLKIGRRGWVYWPEEGVVECATWERIDSHRRHRAVIALYRFIAEPLMRVLSAPRRLGYALRGMPPREMPGWVVKRMRRMLFGSPPTPSSPGATLAAAAGTSAAPMVRHAQRLGALRQARQAAKAISFPKFAQLPDANHRIEGCGVYIRTDFWAPLVSGGSYGHTCYVAKELAAVTDSFVCFMANHFPLLDQYGIRQIVMPRASQTNNEDDVAAATPHYLNQLRPAFQELRPAYIYERLGLGNSAGALLSAEFSVPYILEYNGSEISMRRSFDGAGYLYESEYLEAEALAFEQATLISVVSAEIRSTLVKRGIDPSKILVNPNGVDLQSYAPPTPAERDEIRRSVGFAANDRVVGFTGTFGGWHGIDVLGAAIPRVCASAPAAKFLLIGDGGFKHLVDQPVKAAGLEPRVLSTGRVPQVEGARLLKACDVYVSPHSTHMIDSKFFGSPTKLFEYMALGGGIVASDLEQIGQVLSPALTPPEAAAGVAVSRERAVLCQPGNVDEFVEAVVALVDRPEMASALGQNAHQAAVDHYSWERHVANLWRFLSGETLGSDLVPDLQRKPRRDSDDDRGLALATPAARGKRYLVTGDAYKDQVQRQWNNDPAGSHYVQGVARHTKEWFLEVERHRYGVYAPWMPRVMEFDRHRGETLLEIGAGMGTDLAQFALHGARVTDVDLSVGHLELARENFTVRGLAGEFIQHDAETLPFEDNRFDVVYSNGVLHHTPNTRRVVEEICRVLKPGGLAIVMLYAEDSVQYWRNLVWAAGLREGQLRKYSMGEIMSRMVERSDNASAHPLVKVYTRSGVRQLFDRFVDLHIDQRHMQAEAVPRALAYVPRRYLERIMGWNLIVKARKPGS